MNLSDAIEDLYTRCPGIPDELLITAYRDAARRFLRRVRAWVIDSPTWTQGTTTAEYLPTLPTDAELVDIQYPKHADTDIERLTYDQAVGRGWPATGTVRGTRLAGTDSIIVMPDPGTDISADLAARLVLRPTRDATTIPDDIVRRFNDALEYGALMLVYATPGHALSSANSSQFYRTLFEDLIDVYETYAGDGNMRGINRTVRYNAPGSY